MAIKIIDDPLENTARIWQCCYVLSGIGDASGIAPITRALQNDDIAVRNVAATALGQFDDPTAHSALEAAAETEKNPSVQDSIRKALNGEFLKKKK